MTTTALDLTQYSGKKVVVYATNKEDPSVTDEIEGTVQIGTAVGLLIKLKGKSVAEIIEAERIDSIEAAPEPEKKIRVRYVKDVTVETVRKHLVDMHAVKLSDINGMTGQSALDWHASMDHEALDLGHRHGEKPKRASDEVEQEATE